MSCGKSKCRYGDNAAIIFDFGNVAGEDGTRCEIRHFLVSKNHLISTKNDRVLIILLYDDNDTLMITFLRIPTAKGGLTIQELLKLKQIQLPINIVVPKLLILNLTLYLRNRGPTTRFSLEKVRERVCK